MAIENFKVKFDVDLITSQRTITMPDNDVSFADATKTSSGFIELATQEEVNVGTNDTMAVTPLTLKTLLATLSGGGDMIAFSQVDTFDQQVGKIGLSFTRSLGDFTYTFTDDQPDINYLILVELQEVTSEVVNTFSILNKSTTGFLLRIDDSPSYGHAVRILRVN